MLAHRAHSELASLLAEDESRGAVVDKLAQGVGDAQVFDDGLASLVARTVADLAALAEVERAAADLVAGHLDTLEGLVVGLVGGLALLAAGSDETLAQHTLEGGRQQVGRDVHVDEAGNGAGGVVRMEGREDEVACKGGLDGDLGRLEVTDLADHHHVGVLTQEGAQHLGERIAGLRVDRHLDDSVHIVFDRFLGGEEFGVDLVDAPQDRVEGGCLAGAGRTGNDEDSVRLLDIHRDLLIDVFGQADVLEVERGRRLVENTHDDGLAVGGREAADTKVDRLAGDGQGDTAVLRHAALGDVEVRKDLDARDDGGGHLHVGRLHGVEGAIDTVADLEVVLEGFDMDVGRAVDDALVEDEVDEADDRGRVGGTLHRSDVVGVGAGEPFIVRHALAKRLDHVGDGIVRVPVVLGDAVHHVLLAGEDEAHLLRECEEHLVGDSGVDEVERREGHGRVVGGHGEDVVHSGGRGGDGLGHVGLDRHRGEVDGLGILIGGHRRQQVVLGEDLLVEDGLADALALGLRDILHVLGGGLVEVSVLDKNLEYRV